MYAVIEMGGRQYKLEKDDVFLANRISGEPSSVVKFKDILFIKDKTTCHVGQPYVKNAYVACEVLAHPRAKKVFAFKYKRRKGYKRKVGHRQDLTRLRVKDIKTA